MRGCTEMQGYTEMHGCTEMHDYPTAKGFGRNYRTTTFFKLKDGELGFDADAFMELLMSSAKKLKKLTKKARWGKNTLCLPT